VTVYIVNSFVFATYSYYWCLLLLKEMYSKAVN